MYNLYYALRSASMGIRVILEEIGAPYELIQTTLDRTVPRSAEQMALNPNGWVPVLTWDDGSMYEAAAITIYLCDKHPNASLAPAIDHPTRPLYLQTLTYFSNSIQNAYQLTYYPDRFVDISDDEPSAVRRGQRRLCETWQVVDDQIGNNTWLLGDKFSAADIYMFMLTTWIRSSKGHPNIADFPNVARIADKVADLPSVREVYAPWFANPNY